MGYFENNLSMTAVANAYSAKLAADRLVDGAKASEAKSASNPVVQKAFNPALDTLNIKTPALGEATTEVKTQDVKTSSKEGDFEAVLANWDKLDDKSKNTFLTNLKKMDLNIAQKAQLEKLMDEAPKTESYKIAASLSESVKDQEAVGPTLQAAVKLRAENKIGAIVADPATGKKETDVQLVKEMVNDKRLSEQHRITLAKDGVAKVHKEAQIEAQKAILDSKSSSSEVRSALAEGITKFDDNNQQAAVNTFLSAKTVDKDNKVALADKLDKFASKNQVNILNDFLENVKSNNADNTEIRNAIATELPQFAVENQEVAADTYLQNSAVNKINKITLANVLGKFDDSCEVSILNNFLGKLNADTPENTEIRDAIAYSLPDFAVDNQLCASKLYLNNEYVTESNRNTFAQNVQYFDSSVRVAVAKEFNDCSYVTAENKEALVNNVGSLSQAEQSEVVSVVSSNETFSQQTEICKIIGSEEPTAKTNQATVTKAVIDAVSKNPDVVKKLVDAGYSSVLIQSLSELSLQAQFKLMDSMTPIQMLAVYDKLSYGLKDKVNKILKSSPDKINLQEAKIVKEALSKREVADLALLSNSMPNFVREFLLSGLNNPQLTKSSI